MLTILTGQPGNGKTLLALHRIAQLAKKESRPVFYSGIPINAEALPDWQELGDVTQRVQRVDDKIQFDLPPNAIVVVDEAQRMFRVRAQGARVPDHVAAFETHRHTGVDFWLLTQHPQLIDTALRKLAGYHIHVVRRAGLERTNVYEWEQCESDPMSEKAKKLARHSVWKFPQEVYGWYKSAEVHTHKRNLPLKQFLFLGAAGLVVIASASYTAWHVMNGAGIERPRESRTETASASSPSTVIFGNPWSAELRQARLQGYENTAAFYDDLQKAQSQPSVAGCYQLVYSDGRIDCTCHTGQGSKLPIKQRQCLELMQKGWFDASKPAVDVKAENIAYLNSRDRMQSDQASASPEATGSTSKAF